MATERRTVDPFHPCAGTRDGGQLLCRHARDAGRVPLKDGESPRDLSTLGDVVVLVDHGEEVAEGRHQLRCAMAIE
jgi:hypothetical protein